VRHKPTRAPELLANTTCSQGNYNASPNLAIFVRSLGADSVQAQVITIKGKWAHISKGRFLYTLPGFLDPKVIEPIVPYLPTKDVEAEMVDQTMIFDTSVPRAASAPIITALKDFTNKADAVYRQNAARLDAAHDILSHPTDLRFGSIEKIATKLLGTKDHTEHALFAVRRALLRADICFGTDMKSHRTTGMFQIRSQEQVRLISTVQRWLRNYQEWKIATAATGSSEPQKLPSNLDLKGVETVQGFIAKCKMSIPRSRQFRKPTHGGCLGPTKERYSLTDRLGVMRKELRAEFNEDERLIIRFLEFWCLQNLYTSSESLLSLAPLAMRDTGMYEGYALDKPTCFMFLMEIGVLEPFANRVSFDVNLLLPSSQHSKPLEQLATSLSKLNKADADLSDVMADLRHDFKDLTVFCIDAANAKEIDDGISVERIGDSTSEFWVHVHIANPTAFVKRDSVFAKMAAHLTESFYSPEKVYPMLPDWMSRQLFSLGPDRPTLTFSAKLNGGGEVLDYKIQPGFVRNVVKVAYDDLPAILGEPEVSASSVRLVVGGTLPPKSIKRIPLLSSSQMEDLKLLQSLSLARYKYRRARGGVYYQPINVDVDVYDKAGEFGLPLIYPRRKHALFTSGDPVIEIYAQPYKNWFDASQGSNTDHLVREMMMMAGEVAGLFARDRDVPIIYRGMLKDPYDKESIQDFERNIVRPAVERYGVIPLQLGQHLVNKYGRSHISTDPVHHPLMGLDHYCKITSPLRRYGDMITHWQIEATLREESRVNGRISDISKSKLAFSKTQVQTMISSLQPRERLIVRAKQTCKTHWITQFYFRAYDFNELDLPRRFNIVIDMHQHHTSSSAVGRFTYGTSVDFGTRVSISPNADWGKQKEFMVGDVWEVEMGDINPYLRFIDVMPLRLVKREMD
jgi:hypothetical protein